jgi:hypothetical protein
MLVHLGAKQCPLSLSELKDNLRENLAELDLEKRDGSCCLGCLATGDTSSRIQGCSAGSKGEDVTIEMDLLRRGRCSVDQEVEILDFTSRVLGAPAKQEKLNDK